MARTLLLSLLVFAALVGARPAAAQAISRNNPYASFNLSGVNYGSQQWEREHGNRASLVHRNGGFLFRRR